MTKPAYHQPPMSSEVPDALKLIAGLRAEGASIRKIVEHLNESGIKATRGGIWHVRTVQLALAQSRTLAAHATTFRKLAK